MSVISQHGMCSTPDRWPSIIACAKSMYGAASLMKRFPSPLTTNCAGIMRSLSMNCSRPSGQHIAGNHHASSSSSVAAPTFSAARIPSPRLAGLPKLQSFSRTGRCSLRQSMSWSNPPAARMTPRRAPIRTARPAVSTTAPTTSPSGPVINSVIGASSHSGMFSCFMASRIRAARDWPMAAIRSPNTRARTIRQISLTRTALPRQFCRT